MLNPMQCLYSAVHFIGLTPRLIVLEKYESKAEDKKR